MTNNSETCDSDVTRPYFYGRGYSLFFDDGYVSVVSNKILHNIFNNPVYTGTEFKKEATLVWLKLLRSKEWLTTTKK
jgi:hypothetical protein